jgi:hypothetical protein
MLATAREFIDSQGLTANEIPVLKRRLSLLLLLGALFGLFGQGVAYASGPARGATMEVTHTIPAGMDCPEMAAEHKQTPEQPCKGLTLACIAQMGCVVPMTFEEPQATAQRAVVARLAATWPPSPVLAGLDVAPEPEPPTV